MVVLGDNMIKLILAHWLVKQCTMCNGIKSLNKFYSSKNGKHNRHSRCRDCESERTNKYYNENSSKVGARGKIYRKNNPQQIWAKSTIISHLRKGFVFRFTKNDLTQLALETEFCSYCRVKLDWSCGTKNGKAKLNSPSLDRIDNNKNILELSNIAITCFQCGSAKSHGTITDFMDHTKRLNNNLNLLSGFGSTGR